MEVKKEDHPRRRVRRVKKVKRNRGNYNGKEEK